MDKTLSRIMKLFLSLLMVISVLHLPSLRVSDVFANTDEAPVEETMPETETTAESTEEDVVIADQVQEEVAIEEAPTEAAEKDKEFVKELELVTVKAIVKAGTFSEDVEFVVDPIYENTNEFAEAEEALAENGVKYDGIIAFDIYFKRVSDGEKIQPDDNVSISMALNEAALKKVNEEPTEVETVSVTHITEDKEVVTVADVTDETEGTVEVTGTEEAVEAVEATFEVDGFSTFTLTWTNAETSEEDSATIHWMDFTSGEELDEALVATLDLSAASINVANTFDGYTYLSTTYLPADDTAQPSSMRSYLYKTEGGWEVVTYTTNEETHTETETRVPLADGDDIYVYYTKNAPHNPNPDPTSNPGPTTIKSINDDDGDGVQSITLDVSAPIKTESDIQGANVLLVVDTTSSMGQGMTGATNRFEAARSAIQTLINVLETDKNTINLSLVEFNRVPVNTYGYTNTNGWTNNRNNELTNYVNNTTDFNHINYTPATGGTNWEAGLYRALTPLGTRDTNNATYVIFLTDGQPNGWGRDSYSNTRTGRTGGRDYYDAENGTRYYSAAEKAVAQALNEGTTIVGTPNTSLYAVYCGSSTTDYNMLNGLITTVGGVRTINATSSSALEEEFRSIAHTIVNNLGSSNVSVDDGVTELSSVSANVTGNAGGYEYFISYKLTVNGDNGTYKDSDGETHTVAMSDSNVWSRQENVNGTETTVYYYRTTWADAPGASFSEDNGVTWDLSATGVLQADVVYSIKFDVWPSQEAFDLIADLNNGTVSWDSLDEDVKAQINKNGNSYSLKTNTHLKTTYTFNGETYTDPANPGQGSMPLESETMAVVKDWVDTINDRNRANEVEFYLKVNGEYYKDSSGNKFVITVKDKKLLSAESYDATDESKWKPADDFASSEWRDTVEIAPGIVHFSSDGTAQILETGHLYTLEEGKSYTYDFTKTERDGKKYYQIEAGPEEAKGYSMEFQSQVVRPMFVTDTAMSGGTYNGKLVYLVQLDSVIDKSVLLNDKKYTIEGVEYGVLADADHTNNASVTGTNFKTSELDITKEIDARLSNMSAEDLSKETFTYTIKLTVPEEAASEIEGIAYWIYGIYTGTDPDEGYPLPEYDDSAFAPFNYVNGTKYIGDNNDEKHEIPSSAWNGAVGTFDVTINRTQIIRLTNLPTGTTYEIVESAANEKSVNSQGYIVTDIAYSGEATLSKTTASDTDTISGTIDSSNTRYYNKFKNKVDAVDAEIKVTKVIEGREWTADDSFNFTLVSSSDTTPMPDTEMPVTATSSAKTQSFGQIRFAEVGTYTYTITEENGGKFVGDLTYASNPVATVTVTVTRDTSSGKLVVSNIAGGTYTAATETAVANVEATVTNTFETATVAVEKAWKNADGSTTAPTGASVVFTLSADGTATSYTVTLNGSADSAPTGTGGYESEAWVATFVNLPKYKAGTDGAPEEITYTVTETTTYPGYTMTYPEGQNNAVNGDTITNTQVPTTANAIKAWQNADGSTAAPTGATVVFTLYVDNSATNYTVTLDGTADTTVPTGTAGYESAAWTATFINLPKYQPGTTTEIVYTVKETTTYPGYTPSDTDPVASGSTITNTQVPTTANATKAWQNADGTTTPPTGASVVFTLYADDTATTYTVTLDGTADTEPTGTAGYESAAWTATFINLPKYKVGTTTEIVYTVKETTTYPGFTPSDTDPVASGSTITNAQVPTEVNAKKAWKNADGSETAPANATVEFTLYADGTATSYKVTLDGTADPKPTGAAGYESEAWTATFVNLPKEKIVNGEAVDIVYTIAETTTYPGYTASTKNPVVSGSTITNTQEPTTANATKAWKNADGSTTAPANATVVFTLYADGTATNYTVTLDGTADTKPETTGGYESAAWKAEFVNLPKYKVEEGKAVEIVYTVAETTAYPGYTADPTTPVASGETITNTQKETNANAVKAWKNADGTTTPPTGASVIFTLYADGVATSYTVTLDGTADTPAPEVTGGYESEAWKAMFVHLPESKIVNGTLTPIVYTVGETGTYPGYTPDVERVESGNTITNTQITTEVTVDKKWVNADGTTNAPEGAEITLTLTADGQNTDKTVKLNAENKFTATVTGIAKYQADGKTEIKYSFTEAEFAGYESAVVVNEDGTVTVTNTQITTEVTVDKKWVNVDDTTTAPEGAEITLTLTADGQKTDKTVKLNAENKFTATVTGIAKYQADGKTEIKYSFTEAEFAGYESAVVVNNDGTVTVTNTQIPTEVEVSKEWVVEEEFADMIPDSIKVQLYKGEGETREAIGEPVELTADDDWTYTFENLPKYDGKEEIKYTVDEILEIGGFVKTIDGSQAEGYVITNTYTPVKYDPPVKKIVEGEGYDPEETFTFQFKAVTEGAPMPEKTEVTIKANEEAEFGWMYLTEPDTYEYEISEVPGKDSQYKYDDTVYKLVFTIGVSEETNELTCELKVNGEVVDHEAQNAYTFEFTNIFRKNVEVEVEKIWADSDNAAGTRPEEIEVTLYAGDKAVETVKLNAKNEWKHTFTDLPAVDENDKKIEYTVKEDKVPEGYTMTSAQSNNKVTITNSKTPDTGDMSNVTLWMSLFGASMAGTLGAAYVSLKKKKEEE